MHTGPGEDPASMHVDAGRAAGPAAGEGVLRTSSAGEAPPDDALSARDAAILEFEAVRPGLDQADDQEIRDRFAMSSTRYFQLLNHLLDQPAALAHDPVLVGRLRRVRDARRRARSAARLPG